jgi:hypothetical protein
MDVCFRTMQPFIKFVACELEIYSFVICFKTSPHYQSTIQNKHSCKEHLILKLEETKNLKLDS